MKRNNKQSEHPEVKDIKNICDVSPKTKITKTVCDKIEESNQHSSNKKRVENK